MMRKIGAKEGVVSRDRRLDPAITPSCILSRLSLRRFIEARNGATAVEFALISIPFIAMIGACIETGANYYAQEILQQAVTEAGRQIYTGQFQTSNIGTTDTTTLLNNFRTALCAPDGQARITTFPCGNVRISITKAASFDAATPVQPTVTDPKTGVSDWNAGFTSYSCARASDIVIIQAAIDVPAIFTFLNLTSTNLPNRRRVIQAATVFQVEPYNSNAACPLGT